MCPKTCFAFLLIFSLFFNSIAGIEPAASRSAENRVGGALLPESGMVPERFSPAVGPVQEGLDAATRNFLSGLSGTRYEVAMSVIQTVNKAGGKVVFVGSWISGKNYLDPLLGGTSDHDMRLVFEGSEPLARAKYGQIRREIINQINQRFGPEAGKVLQSINLYPPEVILDGIDDAAEALQKLQNIGINPNLGDAVTEGLWGKGAKAFRDAYEVKAGRVIWKEGNVIRSGFADLLTGFGENAGIYTIQGSGNTAMQFAEKIDDALKAGDARVVEKQLQRLRDALKKGRDLGRFGNAGYLDDLVKHLDDCCSGDLSKLAAEIKDPAFQQRLAAGLQRAKFEAGLLLRYAAETNPENLKILRDLLEVGSGKWARVREALLHYGGRVAEVGGKVRWDLALKGLFAVLTFYQIYDYNKKITQADLEGILQNALIDATLMVSAKFVIGFVPLILKAIMDDAVAYGYALITAQQDCQDLIAGIYEVKGRESLDVNQRAERNVGQLATQYTDDEKVLAVVALHARNASVRNGQPDEKVEKILYERCGPEIVDRWRFRRIELLGEAIDVLKKMESQFNANNLLGSAKPEELWLVPDREGSVEVRTEFESETQNIQQSLIDFEKKIKLLGGTEKLVQVAISHRYRWMPYNLTEEVMAAPETPIFDREKGRREIKFTSELIENLRLEYELEVDVQTIVDDVLSVRSELERTFAKSVSFNLNVRRPGGVLEIVAPADAKAGQTISLTAKPDENLKKLPGGRLVWFDLSRGGAPKTGDPFSFTLGENETKNVRLEMFAKLNAVETKVAQAEKSVTAGKKDESAKTETGEATGSGGTKLTGVPKSVRATDIFSVGAVLPPGLQGKVARYSWSPNSCAEQPNSLTPKLQFLNPSEGRLEKHQIIFSSYDAQNNELDWVTVPVEVRPVLLGGSAADVWEGGSHPKGLHLERKQAVRKRSDRGKEINSATVSGRVHVEWDSGGNLNDLDKQYDSDNRKWGRTEVRAFSIGNFKGRIWETPGAVPGFTGSGFVDAGYPSAGASGSGYAINGCVLLRVSYSAGGGGAAFGDGTGFGKLDRAWWNDLPFLMSQTRAAAAEAKAIIGSLQIGEGGTIARTPYKGPKLDGSDLATLKLIVSPDVKKLKKGDAVNVQAVIENEENAEKPLVYNWTGDHAGSGASVKFLANKPGRQSLSVSVPSVGSAAVEFEVADLKAEIKQAAPAAKVMVGVPVALSAQLLSDGKPVTGSYVYRFQPSPEVRFDTNESAKQQTNAIFPKPGREKVWVQVLEKKGEILETVAESEQIEIEVVAPELKINFDTDKALVGKPVKATVEVVPADLKDIDFRWELPANVRQTGQSTDAREITFIPQNAEPITVRVNARVPHSGEALGTKEATLTARKYEVSVTVLGAEGPPPQVWREGVGLVTVENAIAVHQFVGLRAEISPEAEDLRYQWSLNEDSHFAGNSITRQIRVTRSQTGTGEASVVVRDRDGIELGRGTGIFNVSISQADLDKAKNLGGTTAKLTEAKEIIKKGQLDDAIALADEVIKLDPKNTEASALSKKWKQDRAAITAQLQKARTLMDQQKFVEASNELIVAKNLHNLYPPVLDFEKEFNEKWRGYESGVSDGMGKILTANQDKQFKKALQLAADLRAKYQLIPVTEKTLQDYEQWARTHEAEKERQRAILKRGEEKFRQYDFAGAFGDLSLVIGASGFYEYWNSNYDPEPAYYQKIKDEAFLKNKLIAELLKSISNVVDDRRLGDQIVQKALKDCDEVLAIQPPNADAQRYKAELQKRLSDRGQSNPVKDPPRDERPESEALKKGEALHTERKYAEAIAEFDAAIRLNANSAEAHRLRARSKRENNDLSGSRKDFDKAIELDPKNYQAYLGRGLLREKTGDTKGALNDFTRGIELSPDSPNGYNYRGQLKLDLKDNQGAIGDFDRVLALDPKNASAWINRGLAKLRLNDPAGAIGDLDQAIRLDPKNRNAYVNRGLAKERAGDARGAISDYDRAIEIDPNYSLAYNNRGYAKELTGDLQGALKDYEKAVALDLSNQFAKNNLAKLKEKMAGTEAGNGSGGEKKGETGYIDVSGTQWNWYDPNADASYNSSGETIVIRAPKGNDLWPATNFDAPRLTKRVTGDFVLQARLRGQWREGYNGAGLVVHAGRNSVIRLERGVLGAPTSENHVAIFGFADGRETGRGHIIFPQTDLYLRLIRKGNEFTGFASTDGSSWKKVAAVTANFPAALDAGLLLVNEYNSSVFQTTFSEFKLMKPSEISEPVNPPAAAEAVIFNNGNVYGVQNQPTALTRFTIAKPHVITYISTYHWNNARGNRAAGFIGIYNDKGERFGPWQATGAPGQGGVPNANWEIRPNVTIPAGTYTIVVSQEETWSQNAQSGGQGMAVVKGYPTGVNTTVAPVNPPSNTTGQPASSATTVTAVFQNRSGEAAHIFAEGDTFGPNNRIPAGGSREVGLKLPADGRIKFYAGRNGQVITSKIWNGNPGDPSRYPKVIFDGTQLLITTGLR